MALTDNLISHWKLDEASGNAIDSHGTNDLTETSGLVDSATGKVGNCRDFEADDTEYLTHADNADFDIGDIDFTVAAWLNMETLTRGAVVSKTSPTNGEFFLLYDTTGNRLKFSVYSGAGFTGGTVLSGNSLGAPSAGVWYFLVAWHDSVANTINLQINNGSVDSTSHSTGVFQTTGDFSVGGNSIGVTNWIDGLIDEVSFWKRVLTSDERTTLYNGGSGRAYPWSTGGSGRLNARRMNLVPHVYGRKRFAQVGGF